MAFIRWPNAHTVCCKHLPDWSRRRNHKRCFARFCFQQSAGFLTHSKSVVKFVIEAVANYFSLREEGLSSPFIKVCRQTLTVRQRLNRSLFRQPAVIAGFRLVLKNKEGEIGLSSGRQVNAGAIA
ncbi:hypothetical protein ACNKHT_01015 [Shigella flexneri]